MSGRLAETLIVGGCDVSLAEAEIKPCATLEISILSARALSAGSRRLDPKNTDQMPVPPILSIL
jgi:hypothetical protein